MKTMNRAIFEKFKKIVEQYRNREKIVKQMKKKWTTEKKWISMLSELQSILEKEFNNENVVFEIRTTFFCGRAWYTELINDEARVYTSFRKVGRYYISCNYLAMMVRPKERKIPFQNGYAYYEYKKTQRRWVTRLVVKYINKEYHYGWRNNYYVEREEKKRIKKAIAILSAQKSHQPSCIFTANNQHIITDEAVKDTNNFYGQDVKDLRVS